MIVAPFGKGFLADSYALPLAKNGHDVFVFDSDRAYFEASRYAKIRVLRRLFRYFLWKRLNFSTIEIIRCVKPDLVLVFKGAYLDPETIHTVRVREGTVIANYYPDNPYCGVPLLPNRTSAQRRDIIECLRQYSCVFTWNNQLVEKLERDDVRAKYLPFGADSSTYSPSAAVAGQGFNQYNGIVFVGQRNIKRDLHIGAIRKHEVAIWGNLWGKASKQVRRNHKLMPERAFGADCAAIYANSGLALNIVDDLNMPGHNMRTFEIPSSGGLMLSTYTEEQAQFFPEGEAALYYRDPGELDDIIDYILKDKAKADLIKKNALSIAKDHSYEKRAAELIKGLGDLA